MHFQQNVQIKKVAHPLPRHHLQFIDIAALVADDLGDLGQGADLVQKHDIDPRRKFLVRGGAVPGQVDPAFRLAVELFKRPGENRIDRNAFARHRNAHNAFARNRAGFLGNGEGHVAAQAPHRNRGRVRLVGFLGCVPLRRDSRIWLASTVSPMAFSMS